MALPTWLMWLSSAARAVAFAAAAAILYDIVRCTRRMMAIMTGVWPITALSRGPVAIGAYRTRGLSGGQRHHDDRGDAAAEPDGHDVFKHDVFKGVTHCVGGCTVGDIVGAWAVFIMGVTLAGLALWPEYRADVLLASILGIVFQYVAIAPLRGLSLTDGLIAAMKADTLSLAACEVGLFGWMALTSCLCRQPPASR